MTVAGIDATATEEHVPPPLLELSGIQAGYGRTTVLRDVTLEVPPSTVVALLGANGAGKTTLLRVASGLLRPAQGAIRVDGTDVTGASAHRRARRGVCLIPEGRGVFRSLSVRENLELQVPKWVDGIDLDRAVTAFPVLGNRLGQTAGSLSGGEQQMLALARSLMAEPRVVLLDEVSMGLAPLVVDQIFESLERLSATGISLVVVEQYVNRALEMADLAYLITRGGITWNGPAADLDEAEVIASYLGTGDISVTGTDKGSA